MINKLKETDIYILIIPGIHDYYSNDSINRTQVFRNIYGNISEKYSLEKSK